MRLLQINPNGSETTALDFHPMVTVVTGLTPSGHDIVLRVARSLARAQDPGFGGLVEAHGVLLDLNHDTLELLDLQGDVENVVSGVDLPTGEPPEIEDVDDEESEPAAAPVHSHDELEAFIVDAPWGRSDDFDHARRRRADSREALAILQEAFAKAQVEFEKVLGRQKLAEAELAAAREASAPILRLVQDDESEGEQPAEPVIDAVELRRQRDDLVTKIGQLEATIAGNTRGLEELATIDTRPLTVLLDAIRNPAPIEYVPSERAGELADEVIDLERKVADLEKELDKRGLASGSALKQLEVARMELKEAEKAMRKPELTPDDIAELEAAHEEVLAVSTRKRGGQKRQDQAMAKQQEILDRIGFPTWSAYVMGAGLLAIDHAAEQRAEQARLDLEAAESHWGSVCEEIESNPEHRRLLDRLEDVYLEAFDLLGGADPEDLEGALRNLQVPKREVTTEELIDALAYQLELVGLQLPESAGPDFTIVAAEAFVDEAQEIDGRVAELRDERATAEAELAVARGKLDTMPEVELPEVELPEVELPEVEEDDEPGSGDSWGSFDQATKGGAEPSRSLFGGVEADDPFGFDVPDESADDDGEDLDVAALEVKLDEAVDEVVEYTEWVESRQALVDATLTIETVSASRLMKIAGDVIDTEPFADFGTSGGEDLVAGAPSLARRNVGGSNGSSAEVVPPSVGAVAEFLSARLDAQRQISYAGALPLVLDDTLQVLGAGDIRAVLDHVQNVSDSVQVIYLTEDAAVAAWAEDVGFQRAAVVPAPIGFG